MWFVGPLFIHIIGVNVSLEFRSLFIRFFLRAESGAFSLRYRQIFRELTVRPRPRGIFGYKKGYNAKKERARIFIPAV